jgi:hypothetical protein
MTNGNEPLAYLHVEYGPEVEVGRVFTLAVPQFILGRDEACHFRVNDPRLSRQHAAIAHDAARYFLSDLNSRNGTFLNGQRLGSERHLLNTGDEIQLGTLVVLRFEDPATTLADLPSPVLMRGLWLDPTHREVYVQRRKLEPPLSDKLFKLLEILVAHPGDVIPKDQIALHVWPEATGEVSDQMIDALVTRLRRRLLEADEEHEYVIRVRKSGLRFVQRV